MAQASGTTGCLGCLNILFFVVFVLPSIVAGLFSVMRGDATVGLKGCSFNLTSGAISCNPEITAKYQFFDISDLESKKDRVSVAIQKFHAQLGRGACETIFEQSGDDLKRNYDQARFLRYCEGLSRTVGSAQSFEAIAWEWLPAVDRASEYVRVSLTTHAENGSRDEVLIWRITNNQIVLDGHGYALIPLSKGGR